MRTLLLFFTFLTFSFATSPVPYDPSAHIQSELEIAIIDGNLTLVDSLLNKYDINQDSKRGTPLSWAITEANYEMVQFLVSRGADINTNKSTFSPLHWATKFSGRADDATKKDDTIKILKFLVKNGANVNAVYEDTYPNVYFNRYTPIFLATNSYEATKFLLEHGAKTDLKDLNKNTILHYLAFSSTFDMGSLELLLKSGVDINAQNSNGYTALHTISIDSYSKPKKHETVALFIKNGAKLNIKSYRDKEDILRYSISKLYNSKDINTLEVLLENGANPNSFSDRLGTNSLHEIVSQIYPFSSDEFDKKFVQLLLNSGAKINSKTKIDKKTPLDLLFDQAKVQQNLHDENIKKFENLEIVRLLRKNGAKFSSEL